MSTLIGLGLSRGTAGTELTWLVGRCVSSLLNTLLMQVAAAEAFEAGKPAVAARGMDQGATPGPLLCKDALISGLPTTIGCSTLRVVQFKLESNPQSSEP